MIIKDRDIVVVGIQPWDIEIGSNCKDIAKEFSRNNRVLYVNNPVDHISILTQKDTTRIKNRINAINNPSGALEQLNDNFWVYTPPIKVYPINFLPSTTLFSWFNTLNNKKFAAKIKSAIAELHFKDYILFNDQSMFLGFKLKEYLKPDIYVYYIRDNLMNVKYWNKHGKTIEPKLIAKADLVFTNSLLYEEYARNYNPKSYMVGQGCDTELYTDETTEIAGEMKALRKPVIGYVGYLSSKRLDIEVIKHIAENRPDYTIVLVGPEDDTFKASTLHQMKNVIFLGSKEPVSLPSYIKGFDVAINPQQLTKATRGNYPRKIDEYLAMGIPTVATKTKAMDYFADSVYLAIDKSEYLTKIDAAIREDSPILRKQRMDVGHLHSWTTCVNIMYDYIGKE
ncbi:MAG: glycosyltransferase [Bacteroidales bacterium]|nr:glycosyltransferase [Bacteroidales bacterium]